MKRYLFPIVSAALIANVGCCCHRNACSPCGTGYGATYAPSYAPAPSTCPGGNCGPVYQSGALISPTQSAYYPSITPTQSAYYPAATPTTSTAALDYLPAY